jgi:two-component system, OmpR family, sensor histidine kinase KdpD
MHISPRKNWIGYLIALAGVASVTALYKFVVTGVNYTTVALTLLLIVLVAASAHGLGSGIVASITGMLCFNFFFLPPIGTLTIQDPQNWVALFAFLVTAVIASQLSAAARRRTRDAERRREEMWNLYQLSRAIIATPDSETAVSSIARQVVEVFGFDYCGVFVPDDRGAWQRLAIATDVNAYGAFTPAKTTVDKAFRLGEIELADSEGGEHELKRTVAYVPLKVGVRSIGVMVIISSALERGTVEAIAGLVALALERARFLKEVSRTEALRQSDELKSALLASVSHDLRTPLTSIRAAIDSLLQEETEWDRIALREFHLIISEEVSRLTKLVRNLLEMARIEAGELKLSKRWQSVAEILDNVLERCESSTRNHRVSADVDEHTPVVKLDSRLVAEALANLVENAAKYSPPGSAIIVRARVERDELIISVTDQGPGISSDEVSRIFDKFYRGRRPARRVSEGTGMGLAITRGIVEAHGGRIWVESAPAQGATFTIAIPVELFRLRIADCGLRI